MVGKLYVHVDDPGWFLLVRRDQPFPSSSFKPSAWRILAIGAEPPDAGMLMAMERNGFCEYRVPAPSR